MLDAGCWLLPDLLGAMVLLGATMVLFQGTWPGQ
jgi:hypothetical protein